MPHHPTGPKCWARVKRRPSLEDRYHAFPLLGNNQHTSFCGISWNGLKRGSPPPRDAPVCNSCADATGFVRRPGRSRQPRERGSRHLGTVTDRIEQAAESIGAAAATIERAADRIDDHFTDTHPALRGQPDKVKDAGGGTSAT